MYDIFSKLFSLDAVYVLTGVVLMVFAWINFKDRTRPCRTGSALFWLTLGIIFIAGSFMPHVVTGMLVLLMVALDGAGRVREGSDARSTQDVHSPVPASLKASNEGRTTGNKIFLPVLVIPLVTIAFAVIAKATGADVNRSALIGLGFGGLGAAWVAVRITGSNVRTLMHDGRDLNDRVGAISILPQLLASLGVIFAASRLGDLIAGGIISVVPADNLFLLVVANCFGMATFTMLMGNSFAAFPVIAAGVLVPLIIRPFGVDPALAAIMTLTAGSTGTLMTPMAANFNIVPTALLEMRDRLGVIKFQLPFAVVIWLLHVALMYLFISLF
ncbi:MAG: DUF979 domain-containing protein [Pyrinomonadaceae bacterium MAG19_C2-C3]|nr:DUF979 domain-containing protein [Pyrinomonadaceae bacterium MAG19_C2-C3]